MSDPQRMQQNEAEWVGWIDLGLINCVDSVLGSIMTGGVCAVLNGEPRLSDTVQGRGGGYTRSLRVSDYMCCASTVAAPLHCHSGFLHYWYSSSTLSSTVFVLFLVLYKSHNHTKCA